MLCCELGQASDILATDIAPEAIADARQATYRKWSFRGESFERVRPHLEPSDQGNKWTLNSQIRQRVRFRIMNLVSDPYPETKLGTRYLDLIFCRNVLIYFNRETTERIVDQLTQCLATGGWLITASADPSLAQMPGLTAVTNDYGTFYQRADPAALLEYAAETIGDAAESLKITSSGLRSEQPVVQSGEPSLVSGVQPARRRPGGSAGEIEPTGGDLSQARVTDAVALYRRVHELEQSDRAAAVEKIAELTEKHPLEILLHYQQARLLLESDQVDRAAKAAQKALFLDQSAIMPHFLFGTIEIRRAQWDSAERQFSTARRLCEAFPADERIPLSDGMRAAELLVVVESQIAKLRNHPG